jgi:hypothetical protein
MSRQENFEAAYAEAHCMPVEAFEAYRMGDTYRLPGIAKCWRFWNMALDSVVVELAPCVDAVAEALGDSYDCTRVWSAWGVGTMDQDDFCLITDDSDRLTEIATAAIEAAGLKVKP